MLLFLLLPQWQHIFVFVDLFHHPIRKVPAFAVQRLAAVGAQDIRAVRQSEKMPLFAVGKGNILHLLSVQQMTEGDSLDNLAATADPAYERQVDELMEKIMADVDENTRARQEGRRPENVTLSDYVDYRTYLDYDIKVTNTVSGQQASLSRVSRDSSGGENQAPFYVAICASLLQIYQKSENSIRLVLLDEAFSKMTSDRIRPMMELFRRMQLQVLLISTVEKSTAIQPYCDITYSIVRHGDVNAIAPFYRLNASEEIGS